MNWLPCVFPSCQAEVQSLHTHRIQCRTHTHILIISSKTGTNLHNEVWPVLTHQTLSRGAGHIAMPPHSDSKTQLNNQGFNCCIIPQSIKKGFLGCLDEIKQTPQETNTQNILAETDETVPDQSRMGVDQKAQRFSMQLQHCPIKPKVLADQNKPQFMLECKHTQTRHLNT